MSVLRGIPSSRWPQLLLLACLLACGACSGPAVEVPILVQELPPRPIDAPVEVYWAPKSLETWLQLAANPEKSPDLGEARLQDTHTLWENRAEERSASKVADLVASSQISIKHPREWLLLELGGKVRELGADTVVVNSIRVQGLTGHRSRDDHNAMWSTGLTMKVWLYAQAVRTE